MYLDDRTRLRHMLDGAREAVGFARGRSRGDLDTDRMLALALVRLLEVVGEAASKITRQFQAAHPEIPWVDVIPMRHRLIHAYFDIRLDVVWETVTRDLPPLIASLEEILAHEPPHRGSG